MKRIKRGAALALLRSQGVEHTERARNYELEASLGRLHGALGGDWMIDEPCPFNGRFCRFGEQETPRRRA